MRKVILSMQLSLDGFVEAKNGDMSWMIFDDEEQWADLFTMWSKVDTFLLGRGMFNDYRNYWKQALNNPKASDNERRYAQLASGTKHIVFSSTLKNAEWGNTEIISGDAVAAISKLKQQPGKDIQVVGGATFAATVIETNLIDEYRLVINPVIVGEGKSFFALQQARHSLTLNDVKKTKSGVMITRFTPR